MTAVPLLDKLDLTGDGASIGQRWEKWLRSLSIYLDTTDIKCPIKKRATLLLLGGSDLQDIFYNLPGANAEAKDNADVFKIAIDTLNDYFAPKQSKVYERHIFRLLAQNQNEKFDQYLVKLRKQAEKCKFDKPDEHLIDQIAEKCSSTDLRKKILTIGDDITLDRIITEAHTLEVVDHQMKNYREDSNQETNAVFQKKNADKAYNQRRIASCNCTRCGSHKHEATDQTCPARGKKCHVCGKLGHFRQWCKSQVAQKRKATETKKQDRQENDTRNKKMRRVNNVEDAEEIDYVFYVDNDATIECVMGGVKLNMLIDSGCKPNLITDKTWKLLKSKNIICTKQVSKPDKTLIAYGSKTPLDVQGSFETLIETNGRSERTTVYVIGNGSRDLLGKDTAVLLGVLKLGIGISHIADKPFPKMKDVLIEIPIDEQMKPVSQPYRRIPIPIEDKINATIKELLDSDIIEEVHEPSKWVSPVVPVLKDNGDLRICVDMRRANQAILRENHPLPSMDHMLPKINKAQLFSKLDIKQAFHQAELHPNSRHLTTFITSKGLYRYKRLMFGISCAPELFQKIVEKMLIQCEGVINFIDDILVYGRTEEEHDERLGKVLEVLKQNNVLLNENKCIYKVPKVSFLGHELTPEGARPLDKYIKSIENFRVPKTIEELQSFLGLTNYINKWIPNFATETEPLKELLRKKLGRNSSLEQYWTKVHDESFQKLKALLTNIQTLGYYDVNDKTEVIADASPVGLGAVLVQYDNNGPRIIAYGNRTLTDCERRYSQTEKEALAMVWAIEHFNVFLFGKQFDLITDHKPLEILFGPKSKPCARIERWVLRLMAYRYNIKYRSGKSNIADSLSRLGQDTDKPKTNIQDHIQFIVHYAKPQAVSMKSLIEHSEDDPEIRSVKKGLANNEWDESIKTYKVFENELCFYNGLLLRGNRIVIPTKLRKIVLDAAHEGHPGIVAMKGRLRCKVWWPRMDKDVETLVKCCKSCTLVGIPNLPVPMKRRELPIAPWVDVAMDLLGPLPSGEYLLVIIDYYSRYKEVKVTKIITSSQIIKLLREVFSRLGYPSSITADNGRQFVSEEFRKFCQDCNIILHNTVPYWPQQNGEVERQNRDILKRLKICKLEKKDLKECLWDYLMMYNSTPHSTTGKTPSELFFKRQNRDKIPSMIDITENYDSEVRDKDKEQKQKGKEYADMRRRAQTCDLKAGDKVYVREGDGNKLTSNFNPTPHVVEQTQEGDTMVRNEETGKVLRRNIMHLKKIEGEWRSINPDTENSEADH